MALGADAVAIGSAALIALGDNDPALEAEYKKLGTTAGAYDDWHEGKDPAGITTQDPELYKHAILVLTALGEEPEILHGLEQGADDSLVKPFKLELLMDKIASLTALTTSLTNRNRVTNLPGTDAAKREINHILARDTALAVVYVDMIG